ncbi:T9SS type A sorting domain-containing protein [bacterium]|nr:MAG: T9SS type A sorting domain-containing protein [bacterium]
MVRYFTVLMFLCACFVQQSMAQTIFPGSTGSTLQTELRSAYYPTSVYSYNRARDTLYARIDRHNDTLECVYTGKKISYTYAEGDASTVAFNKGINAEHTWPQSYYNSESPMVSDLHQLYPAWDVANSTRNNHPFAEIDDNNTATWLYNGTTTSIKPDVSVIDLYAEYYNSSFEPRESHKGNVARTMFYFWTMYQNEDSVKFNSNDNATWFNNMKDMLYEWHKQDPIDQAEIDRSNLIATFQGKQNPFVHDSSLIYRAFFLDQEYDEPVHTSVYAGQIIISQYYEGNSNDKWLEIANVGQFDYNFSVNPLYLMLFSNPSGDLTGISPTSTYALTGSLKADSVWVFKNSGAVNPVQGTALASTGVCNFNGNDVIILSTSSGTSAWGNRTDVFGLTDGSDFAANVSYSRKADVVKASTVWNLSEWDSIVYTSLDNGTPTTNSAYIGTHLSYKSVVIPGSQGWRMLSIPVSDWNFSTSLENIWTQGATGSNAPAGNASLYTFNEAANQFQAVTDFETPSGLGNGYALYVFADDDFNGQADAFPKVISYDDGGAIPQNHAFTVNYSNEGWNLIGNPYPFAIDWNSVEWAKTQVNNTVYIYDNDIEDFKTWNGLTGTNGMSNGIIPAFQSFFIQSNDLSPVLSVTPDAQATDVQLYKHQTPNEIRLRYQEKEAVIVFFDEALVGSDPYDAEIPPSISGKKSIRLLKDGKQFSINALPNDLSEPITFAIENMEHLELLSITNTSTVEYSISEQNGVIQISVHPVITSTQDEGSEVELPATFKVYPAYPNPFNPSTTIRLESPSTMLMDVRVTNVLGQTLVYQHGYRLLSGQNSYTFKADNLPSGLYFISFQTKQQHVVVKATLVK